MAVIALVPKRSAQSVSEALVSALSTHEERPLDLVLVIGYRREPRPEGTLEYWNNDPSPIEFSGLLGEALAAAEDLEDPPE